MYRGLVSFFKDKQYRGLALASFVTILNGTIIYHFVEGWRWIDSLYFSVITLTTVGYGDLSPQTDFGKVFTIIYILTGLGIIFGFVNALFEHRKVKMREYRENIRKKKL